MDNIVYEQSVSNDIPDNDFVSKKWVYVNDLNQGSYQSQVIIDSTSISNQGAYQSISEGFIAMPLLITLTSGSTASLPASTNLADYSWSFKNGFWQILNSMSVQYNNGSVVQQTPFLNVFTTFKAMTSWSLNDLFNDGSSVGFYPDNPSSWSFAEESSDATAISGNGIGLCNNRNAPLLVASTAVATAAISTETPFFVTNGLVGPTTSTGSTGVPSQNPGFGNPTSYNDGMLQRQFYLSYDPNDSDTLGGLNQGYINNSNSCNLNGRSYKIQNSPAGVVQWSVVAKLRLKDLADFFAKMPLVKGGSFRIMMNTNQAITTFEIVKGTSGTNGQIATYPTLTCTSTTINGGLTFPLMVASANPSQGCNSLATDTYNLSVSIYKNIFTNTQALGSSTTNQTLNSCRLYVPLYKMTPIRESEYLHTNESKKTVIYNDIYQFQFTGIAAGQSFNFIVSNGIPSITGILCVPLISAQPNGTNISSNATSAVSTLLSPFSTSGATPDPLEITNFNVKISGESLFMDNEYYDYEAFVEQLRTSNQVNGNATTGFTSGLINENLFSRGMRYYYGDASRILPSEDGISRSVSVLGLNNSQNVAMDLLVFVVFKKKIIINLSNGATILQA
jgi:hypothetical protein